jgi:hypothetical protein
MATEKDADLIEAMISPRALRRASEEMSPEPALAEPPPPTPHHREAPSRIATPHQIEKGANVEGRLEVRPIGTTQGFRELAALHKRTWAMLNVQEKQVHMILWKLALHFGLYHIKPGADRKRPPLIGAFWTRALDEAPLTLGHLYPASLFKGLDAKDVWEFGGMVVEPTFQHRGLMKLMSDTARLFLFSRRPKLIITNPVEPLYEMYKALGLKAVGRAPIVHPLAINVKVWLMYGKFDELAKPYFM